MLGNLRKAKEDRGEEQSKEKDGGSASVGDGPGRTRKKEKSTFFIKSRAGKVCFCMHFAGSPIKSCIFSALIMASK